MQRIRNYSLAVLAAASVAAAAPAIGPSHFVNYTSPDTFLSRAVRDSAPPPPSAPSRAVLISCAALGLLIVKASRE